MKQAKSLIPLLKDRVLQTILEEVIAELERIRSVPTVPTTDVTALRNTINKITGKI